MAKDQFGGTLVPTDSFGGTLVDDTPPRKPAGAVRQLGDVGLAFVQGAAGGTKALTDAAGAGNRVSRALGAVSRGAGKLMSQDAQDEIAARQAKIKDAEASGSLVDEVGATLGGIAEAPARSIAQGAGSIIPTMAAAIATRGRSLGALTGIGAAQGAGAVKGSIYDAVEQRQVDAGMTPEQAQEAATRAQEYTGENAANIGVGAGLGAIASRVGAESAVLGTTGARGALRKIGTAAGEEAITEGAQGGQERYAANVAEQREGFDTPTFQGVAGQAVGEGVIGGIVGGGVSGGVEALDRTQNTVPQPAQEATVSEPLQTGAIPSDKAGGNGVSNPGVFDPNSAVPEPTPAPPSKSQAMGLDPAAGPVSAAAAVAVDNGATETVQRQMAEQQAAEQAKKDGKGKKPEAASAAPVPVSAPVPTSAPTGPLSAAVQNIPQPPGAVDAQGKAQQGAPQGGSPQVDAGATRGTGQDPGQAGAGAVPDAVPEPAGGTQPALSDVYDQGIEKAKRAFAVTQSPESESTEDFIRRVSGQDGQASAAAKPADASAVQAAPEGKPDTVDAPAHATAATSPTNDLQEPTEAQKQAGNYKVGRVSLGGLDISVENPAGSVRKGTDEDGKAWENTLRDHYGYIRGTTGNDKDHVDAFIKPGTATDYAGQVFVVDQVNPKTGKFDEHKILIGYQNPLQARQAYQRNYAKGWKGLQAITPMAWDEFKAWVKDGPKNRPLAAPVQTENRSQPGQARLEPQPVAVPQAEAQTPEAPRTTPASRQGEGSEGTVQPSVNSPSKTAKPSQSQPGPATPVEPVPGTQPATGKSSSEAGQGQPRQPTTAVAPSKSEGENQGEVGKPSGNDTTVDQKARWIKAILDANRLMPKGGVQLTVTDKGKLNFMGDPGATKQGRALQGALDEAIRAGATPAEIAQAIKAPAATKSTPNVPAVRQQLFVQRGNQRFEVGSLEEASDKWAQFRDTTAAGGSEIGNGVVIVDQDGKTVARISYNGNIWGPEPWEPGMKPLLKRDNTKDKFTALPEPEAKPAIEAKRLATPSKEPGSGIKRMHEAKVKKDAEKVPAKPKGGRNLRGAAYDRNPLLTFLATHGLFHEAGNPRSLKTQFSPDKQQMVMGYGPVFKRTGVQDLDILATMAIQDGYLPAGADGDDMARLIERAMRGEKVAPMFTADAAEREAQARIDRQREMDEEQAIADVAAADDNALSSLDDDDIPWDGPGNASDEDFLRAMGASEQEIADATAEKPNQSQAGDQGSTVPQETAAGQAPRDRASGDAQAGDGAQEGLTAPTREDILAQQERAQAAERAAKAKKAADDILAKREEDRKAIAQRSVGAADTFELGGDATQNLTGQEDIFSAPASKVPAEPASAASAPKPDPKEPAKSAAAVENFGEALPPARRAMAAKLDESLSDDDIATRPLSEIWPLAENDAIEDTFAAAVAHAARAEVPAKPRVAYKVKRWVEKVKGVRELAAMIVSGRLTRERFLEVAKQKSLDDWLSKVLLLEKVPRDQWKRIGAVEERPDAFTYQDGKQIPMPTLRLKIDDKAHYLKADGTVAGNIGAIRELLATPEPEQRMEFEIRQRRYDNTVFVNKKGDPERRPLMEFQTVADARKALTEQYNDLFSAWEAVKSRDNITERDLRSEENRPRVGKDHRDGKDVTPEQFQEQFGFRGGEFGKWVRQGKGDKERQAMLNSAYDALMDLSDIVGVPPRAISLNGTLGIAFGSRGTGWASAHFEPSNLVINLTKTRGAGALAHEWFHALDNYFSRLRRDGEESKFTGSQAQYRDNNFITHKPEALMVSTGTGRRFLPPMTRGKLEAMHEARKHLTDSYNPANWQPDPNDTRQVRPEVEQRFANLVQVLSDSPMVKRAGKLDKGKNGYWSSTLEVAARAFENFVQARMLESGYHNDFLANVVPVERTRRNPERYPYLLPGEIQPVADAFGDLFGTVQTRTDDAGNVAIFEQVPPYLVTESGQSDNAPYETDLFGTPIQGTGQAKPAGSRVRGNVQPTGGVQDTAITPGEYFTNTIVGSEVSREVGASKVTTPEQAATATQYLYKSAVERLDGIVTDKSGNVLAVVGGFKGALSQAAIYPATLVGEAVRIPGAANIWFSHNHPSGTSTLSRADENLNQSLADVFRGSGIEPKGLLAVTGDRFSYVGAKSSDPVVSGRAISRSVVRKKVPVIERELVGEKPGVALTDPGHAKQIAKMFYDRTEVPGMMLLNSQNQVVAWVPISKDMMGPLRDTGQLSAIYRAVSQSNAGAAIIVHDGSLDVKGNLPAGITASENIAAALAKVDVRPLDSINVRTNFSTASAGLNVAKGPVFARSNPSGKGVHIHDAAAIVAAVRAALPTAPPIHIMESIDKAPEGLREFIIKNGAENDVEAALHAGEIYVFPGNIASIERMAFVLAHHEIRHYGLRAMLGPKMGPIMLAIHATNPKVRDAAAEQVAKGFASSRILAVEEALADMPVADLVNLKGFDRVIAALRDWLRSVASSLRRRGMAGLADKIEPKQWTDKDVAALIARAEGVSRGGVARYRASGTVFGEGSVASRGARDQTDTPAVDPRNADIRFARGAGQVVTDIKQRAGYKLSDYRALGLRAIGRRQMVDLYGKELPQIVRYNELMQAMDADKNEAGASADGIADRWGKLKDERQLAELMHDATLAQIDPEKDYIEGDDQNFYDALKAGFDALSPEAKKLYVDARENYRAHHANVRAAIRDRIERSELRGPRKAELLKQMDDEFFKQLKGVYFPLARFGDYVVIVRDPDTNRAINVSRAETMNEAQALRESLIKAYPSDKVGEVLKSKEFSADRDMVGRGFMQNLYDALGAKEMEDGKRAKLEDMLGQLYLSALPDLSWAKHGIHRKGTPGFSQDARRAFAQNMFHGARYLAKVRYSDLLENELSDAQKMLEVNVDSFGKDQPKLQDVLNEMQKRHEAAMNPTGNALSTALTSMGFVFHLGLSPASAMVNMTQTALVAYPIMGAKWGFDKAAAALLKASGQAATNKNDISTILSPEERRAFDEAVRSGVIDVTMAHDLAGISQGDDAKVTWKLRPVMKWASFLFHHAEKFNRQVTFVASYRLAREAGTAPREAYAQAVKATYDGHFDYGATNRPRIMQGNAQRVLFLFKAYGQNMVYILARQGYLAVKGANPRERSEARKALGGLLALHAAAAGVLGLPMVTTLLAAASMIGGSDDEPWDAEVALRNMLADAFGDGPADVLARGLSRLTPFDISGRVGLDRLIFPDVQEGLEGQRLGESAMAAALGPVAGIGINVLRGLQQMADGDWARGLEAMAPSALRGPIKALRYADEGAIDRTGKTILDDINPVGIAGQALGFSPSDVRLATEAKSAVHQADAKLTKRRAQLMRHWSMAAIAGDEDGMADAREDIKAFNERHPARRINPMQMAASVRTRRMQIAQAKGGVYLSRSRRDAMGAGAFGMP